QSALGDLEIAKCIQGARLDVLRIELYRASKLALGFRPVPGTQGSVCQSAVCFGERWIQCHGTSSGFHGLRHELPRICEAVVAKYRIAISKSSPRQRVIRVEFHCQPATGYGAANGRAPLIEQSATFHVGLVRLQIRRACLYQLLLTPWKRDLQTLGDRLCDFLLNREDVL